jgi:hypothetical protein
MLGGWPASFYQLIKFSTFQAFNTYFSATMPLTLQRIYIPL